MYGALALDPLQILKMLSLSTRPVTDEMEGEIEEDERRSKSNVFRVERKEASMGDSSSLRHRADGPTGDQQELERLLR